jgi:CheY-like chemotaxis protein
MAPEPAVSETGHPLAILVVEDNREARDEIAAELRQRGCRVVVTGDGAAGLEAVVLERFDVVVTDVEMLPRGGLWLWREATTLRPELRGRFVFSSPQSLVASADGPWRAERWLGGRPGAEWLWAEIRAVTEPGAARAS